MAGAPSAPMASEGEALAAEFGALAKRVSEGEEADAGEALEQMLHNRLFQSGLNPNLFPQSFSLHHYCQSN